MANVLMNESIIQCLKITEKVAFNIASEASYVYGLSGQKFIENAKHSHFGKFMKTWSLQSNSVTRQVNFNETKIETLKISNETFWVTFKQCETQCGWKIDKKSHFLKIFHPLWWWQNVSCRNVFLLTMWYLLLTNPLEIYYPLNIEWSFTEHETLEKKRIPIALLYNAGKKREKAIKESSSVAKREN